MTKYTVTEELALFARQLQSANSFVELFTVAMNNALLMSNQPRIENQADLDSFIDALRCYHNRVD